MIPELLRDATSGVEFTNAREFSRFWRTAPHAALYARAPKLNEMTRFHFRGSL
jgi:hypothetical protein